jgi:hypothetical protein
MLHVGRDGHDFAFHELAHGPRDELLLFVELMDHTCSLD